MPTCHLPQELIDMIVRNLECTNTLTASGLVHPDWVPSSRRYLFNRISIRPENADRFIELVESKRESFTHHIRTILLKGRTSTPDFPSTTFLLSLLPAFSRLPGMHALEFYRLNDHWDHLKPAEKLQVLA